MAQRENPYLNRLGYNKSWNVSFVSNDKKEQLSWLFIQNRISKLLYNSFPEIASLKFDYCKNIVFVQVFVINVKIFAEENYSVLNKIVSLIEKDVKEKGRVVKFDFVEIKRVYGNPASIALIICNKIKQRNSLKTIIREVLRNIYFEDNVKGVKIEVSGRIDGSEISQKKKFFEGNISSSTLDEDVEFGFKYVVTTYGVIGVKVTLCKKKHFLIKNQVKGRKNFRFSDKNRKKNYANSKKN